MTRGLPQLANDQVYVTRHKMINGTVLHVSSSLEGMVAGILTRDDKIFIVSKKEISDTSELYWDIDQKLETNQFYNLPES